MSQLWTITDAKSGAVIYAAFRTAGADQHPKDAGFAWDAAAHRCAAIAAAPVPGLQIFNGSRWVDDLVAIEAALIGDVKARAETEKMAAITRGFGKSEEYRRKAGEAAASATVLAVTLNALSKADALARFPAAWHEAQLSGEQLAAVLARYRARSAAALGVIDRVSAIEQVGVVRIKAATTATTKRAAAAAISWTWSPA